MCTSSEKSPESHRIVNTNGAAIQVTDRGASEPALVFLHYWGRLITHLAGRDPRRQAVRDSRPGRARGRVAGSLCSLSSTRDLKRSLGFGFAVRLAVAFAVFCSCDRKQTCRGRGVGGK